jgi:CRISPR-associated protein Csb2
MPGLRLDIEFLTGRYTAADPFARERPEWPPAPARVFAALAAAAFEQEDEAGLEALGWLEGLKPPAIRADLRAMDSPGRLAAGQNEPPKHFVPVNDTSRKGGKLQRLGRQPRVFPSLALNRPLVQLIWSDASLSAAQMDSLKRLAGLVSYVGESASAARLAWSEDGAGPCDLVPDADGDVVLRVPFRGQLARFAENFASGRNPAAGVQVRYARPQTARVKSAVAAPAARHEQFTFRLEGQSGLRVTHALHVTAAVRGALVKLANEAGLTVPAVLHGHSPEGGRLRENHVIVAPLAHVRGVHADGRVLGFVVLLPTGLPEAERGVCLAALGGLKEVRLTGGNAFRAVRCGPGETRVTLRAETWAGPARVWITVTPTVLNRFTGKRADKSPEAVVHSMCAHVGLPAPQSFELRPEAFAAAIPHTRHFLVRRPHWRPLPHGHLRLEFTEPVFGPVVIGSCRHYGLGLMLPLPDETPAGQPLASIR